MENKNSRMCAYGTLVAGGLIGAGIALLFAPQSGKRTRRDIRHFGKKALNKTEAIGLDLRHSVEDMIDGVSEKLHDGVEVSGDWTRKSGDAVRQAMRSGTSCLKGGAQKLRHVS